MVTGQVHEGEVPSHPARSKRARSTRRVLNEMDEFSSTIDTAAFPYTNPELQTLASRASATGFVAPKL